MNLVQLTRGLQELAAIDGEAVGFAEMVRRAGLDPKRDFRQANMSGADLRGQDLRGFDFRHATFDGAKILGASFDPKLTQRQRASATRDGRAISMFIGHQLEAAHGQFRAAMSRSIVTPALMNEALRNVGREREQHYGAGGVFLSDGRRAVSRLMSNAFRHAEAAIKDSSVTVIFFEPTTDFDFDTLAVVQSRVKRAGGRHFTFVFPSFMDGDAGRRLFDVRAKTAFDPPANAVVFQQGATHPLRQRAAQEANSRSLQFVVEWLNALETAMCIYGSGRVRSVYGDSDHFANFLSGVVPKSGSLVNALRAAEPELNPRRQTIFSGPRALFITKEMAKQMDVRAVEGMIASGEGGLLSIYTYDAHPSAFGKFFMISAQSASSIWNLIEATGNGRLGNS